MAMFDTQHSQRPENDRSSAEPNQESSGTQRNVRHTGDLTRIPLYAQVWGNQPPPWLRTGSLHQAPQERESLQRTTEPTQRKVNTTGLPDTLKARVEQLSGLSMDDVIVHYNSSEPSKFQALAYTQGTEIHVGPGQEQHLAHEAWHVAQQKQGRVKPTLQMKGTEINNEPSLEKEADVMGRKASSIGKNVESANNSGAPSIERAKTVQRVVQLLTKQAWYHRAANLHKKCVTEQEGNNGGGRLTASEASTLQDLQRNLGSDHGAHRVTYDEARQALDRMFTLVKDGMKDDKFTDTNVHALGGGPIRQRKAVGETGPAQ